MPLSAADVQYLNAFLDRRLKNRRGWRAIRHMTLVGAALLMAMGAWGMLTAWQFEKRYVFGPEDAFSALAAKPFEKPSTRPVTFESLKLAEELAESQAKYESVMAATFVGLAIFGVFIFLLGQNLAVLILSRWNVDRQERILITLLREKCAAELALPTQPMPSGGG